MCCFFVIIQTCYGSEQDGHAGKKSQVELKEALSQLGSQIFTKPRADDAGRTNDETVTGVICDLTSLSPEKEAKIIDLLNECPDLKSVQLFGFELTDADLRRLHGRALTSLTLLFTGITRASLPALNSFSSLEELNISWSGIERLEANDLSKLTNLQKLSLSDIHSSALLEKIESFPKLNAIYLGDTGD
jgi:hypothetical protein